MLTHFETALSGKRIFPTSLELYSWTLISEAWSFGETLLRLQIRLAVKERCILTVVFYGTFL